MSRVGIITGASRGLGLALARSLSADGWKLVVDARNGHDLGLATKGLVGVLPIPGDVGDPDHRSELVAAAAGKGEIDLLVNNASILGHSPQPPLANYPLKTLRDVYEVNVIAPLALIQEAMPVMKRPGGVIVNITSDAGIEGYEGWGGYGSSKAALEQVSRVLAAEQPHLRVYWVDPGDMNTRMQQEAFPGEDVSDRPPPEESVPGLLDLIAGRRPSGRYQARGLDGQ